MYQYQFPKNPLAELKESQDVDIEFSPEFQAV